MLDHTKPYVENILYISGSQPVVRAPLVVRDAFSGGTQ